MAVSRIQIFKGQINPPQPEGQVQARTYGHATRWKNGSMAWPSNKETQISTSRRDGKTG